MRPDTLLIDFFRRVYAPLKLAGQRSKVEAVETAIKVLAASKGHEATLDDLVRSDPAPRELGALRSYLVELGVLVPVREPAFRAVVYRGKEIFVPRGEPTPHEIEARAAEIRGGWTPDEMLSRTGTNKRSLQWEPPICAVHSPE